MSVVPVPYYQKRDFIVFRGACRKVAKLLYPHVCPVRAASNKERARGADDASHEHEPGPRKKFGSPPYREARPRCHLNALVSCGRNGPVRNDPMPPG